MTDATWIRTGQWPMTSVVCFVLLIVVFAAPLDGVAIHAGSMDKLNGLLVYASMWATAFAAFATCLLYRKPIRLLGFDWPAPRYAVAAYILPVLYVSLAYSVLWVSGLAPSQFAAFDASTGRELHLGWGAGLYRALLVVSVGVIRSSGAALGEEIGWRGFLVPALADRLSFPALVIVSGLLWDAGHIPAIIWEGYNSGEAPAISIVFFSIMIISVGGIAVWLRLRSQSVWPPTILHGCHNAMIQRLFDPLTSTSGHATWYSSEFGLGLAVTSTLVFAGLLWRFGSVNIRDE